jgi:hypothetical protein
MSDHDRPKSRTSKFDFYTIYIYIYIYIQYDFSYKHVVSVTRSANSGTINDGVTAIFTLVIYWISV